MLHSIQSAVREAYQSKIGQKIFTSSLRVHLSPNFREPGLQQHQPEAILEE